MKKQILFTAFSFFFAVSVMAQEGFHAIGVGAEVALPMGNFGDISNVGFGVTGKVFYGLNDNADITGTLGYLHFGLDDTNYVSGNISMVPIMFGYRHNFGGFYAEPQLGLVALRSKLDTNYGFGLYGGSYSETKFSLSIGGGYAMGDWDFGLRYQLVDNFNFLGLRVGYNFSI
ncbi:MAG TPA: hypothetical protein VLZ54_07730 [Arenibacter sp.]|nr:hypothetical protein [Arenibacter sp.]